MNIAPTTTEVNRFLEGIPSVQSVKRLEEIILQLPQVDLKTESVIHGGMCARTIFIPAGTVLTGALTNLDNICIVCGDITVTTDEGPRRLTGYNVLGASMGYKRVGITHADTWWTMMFKTDSTDPDEVEREMTDEHNALQTKRSALGMNSVDFIVDSRMDFAAFCAEHGITNETLIALSNYNDDVEETDFCLINLKLNDSVIHGVGLFATKKLPAGEVIAPARINGKRALAGRYTNHSIIPNAKYTKRGDNLFLEALRDIDYGEEITIDYRQALSVNPILEKKEN